MDAIHVAPPLPAPEDESAVTWYSCYSTFSVYSIIVSDACGKEFKCDKFICEMLQKGARVHHINYVYSVVAYFSVVFMNAVFVWTEC